MAAAAVAGRLDLVEGLLEELRARRREASGEASRTPAAVVNLEAVRRRGGRS